MRAEFAGQGGARYRMGRFGAVAGGRRLESMEMLAPASVTPTDLPVSVLEVSDDVAIAVSLPENSGREPLHSAGLYEAFLAVREGSSKGGLGQLNVDPNGFTAYVSTDSAGIIGSPIALVHLADCAPIERVLELYYLGRDHASSRPRRCESTLRVSIACYCACVSPVHRL